MKKQKAFVAQYVEVDLNKVMLRQKLYILSTLNIVLILWHTHMIVCAVKKSWFKSWVIHFTFEAYTLPIY